MAIDVKEEKPQYKVIGTRPIRHDGVEKVTGRAQYGADVRPTGLLRGRVLRSPHAHARIRSIDTSAAEALPGVKAVVTHQDFPDLRSKMEDLGEIPANVRDLSSNIMARDKVLYKGHAIAAVAAVDDATAAEALKLIKVDYEVLSPVLHPRDAMKPDAPLLDESR
ncbi:MAG: xanthine dehydrogenase family protein molybdopterin-binding subunit, partial [Chloroflexi bacterium]|nr:xanthine dehydrogenase family protein molybdopterin-binding subunit [Chloroflexota bacterium]